MCDKEAGYSMASQLSWLRCRKRCMVGTHWCYLCGEATTEILIYDHIAGVHDGMRDERYEDEEDFVDEETLWISVFL